MSIKKSLLAILILLTYTIAFPTSTWAEFVVVIDPGHGGKDPGTLKRKGKLNEKEIVLSVALKLGNTIKANHKDVKVVYTRSSNKYLALGERTDISKHAKGDLFISIHVNGADNSSAYGIETYVWGPGTSSSGQSRLQERLVEERENMDLSTGKTIDFLANVDIETKILCEAQREKHNKQSRELAQAVHNGMIGRLKKSSYANHVKNRGVQANNLFVLCYSPMPSILVEMGYLSNPTEEKFLNTDEGLEAFAMGIYDGFKAYKAGWDKRKLGNQPPTTKVDEPDHSKKDKESQKQEENKKETGKAKAEKSAEVWRIQFLSGANLLTRRDHSLKGLTDVYYYKQGKSYKYCVGESTTSQGLNEKLKQVRKTFPGAFITKFDNKGNRL